MKRFSPRAGALVLISGVFLSGSTMAAALNLIDPYTSFNTAVADAEINLTSPTLNSTISSAGAYVVQDYQLPVTSLVGGYRVGSSAFEPLSTTAVVASDVQFARGYFDTSAGFVGAEAQIGTSFSGARSIARTWVLTNDLPTGGTATEGSDPSRTSARLAIVVYQTDANATPLLGSSILGQITLRPAGSSAEWSIERWTYQSGTYDFETLDNSTGSGDPFDFSLLPGYVSNIVNGRTTDYFFFLAAIAEAQSGCSFVPGFPACSDNAYTSAQWTFGEVGAAPVPLPAAAWLLLSGLGGLGFLRRRKVA